MHLPGPLRAAVGLVASAAEEAKRLPDRAIELPMLAVSTALQASLRAQQRYARLAARGDAVLNRRPPTDEPPAWATFDEPVSVEELRRAALEQLDDLGRSPAANQMLDEMFGVVDPAGKESTTQASATQAPAKKAPAIKAPAKKAAPKRAAATKSAVSKTAAKAGVSNSAAKNSGKSVSKPRHIAPSRFDDAGDDAGDG